VAVDWPFAQQTTTLRDRTALTGAVAGGRHGDELSRSIRSHSEGT